MQTTTIRLDKRTVHKLQQLGKKNETYDDIVDRLITAEKQLGDLGIRTYAIQHALEDTDWVDPDELFAV